MGFYKTLRRALTNTGFFDQAKKYDEDTELMLVRASRILPRSATAAGPKGTCPCGQVQALVAVQCLIHTVEQLRQQLFRCRISMYPCRTPLAANAPVQATRDITSR